MRRRLAASAAVLLLVGTPALAGCGSGDGGGDGGGVPDGVTVTGDVGEKPDVEVEEDLDVSKTASSTLVEGDGPEVSEGDAVLVNLTVVNGSTGKAAVSTFDSGEPQLVVVNDEKFLPELVPALVGETEGSRILVTATVEDAIGAQGATQIGLGKDDDVVFVVDLVAVQRDLGPETGKQPAGMPTVVTGEDGAVTGLDFTGAAKPDQLRVATLNQGDGPAVEKGSTIIADYYAAVWGREKPFNDTFPTDPTSFQVGVGGLIEGWDLGLQGVKAGSRVMLVIPPDVGYGAKGSPPDIPGGATLVFVIDVLGVAPPAA
jgi:peptidylprolyl isomerase